MPITRNQKNGPDKTKSESQVVFLDLQTSGKNEIIP